MCGMHNYNRDMLSDHRRPETHKRDSIAFKSSYQSLQFRIPFILVSVLDDDEPVFSTSLENEGMQCPSCVQLSINKIKGQ
jgi:hypothetical protein